MREKWFREHIWWMSFILSLMVVWVHSENVDLFLGEIGRESRVYRLEFFFAQTLGQIAVPGFFMISAYLFYRNFQFSKTVSKWKSRCKSLLLPYVLWNILYYLGYVVVTRLSFVKKIIGKEPVAFGLKELFQAVAYYKYNPVFWYLFQLLLLVVLAPFLYWIICRKWSGLLWLLLLITALWKNVSLPILNLDALFYYSAAGYAVLFSEKVEGENTSSGKKIWFAILILCWLTLWFLGRPGATLHFTPVHTVLTRLLGVLIFYSILKEIPFRPATSTVKNSFFLYAIHFPWARFFNKAGAVLFKGNQGAAAVFFLTMPFLILGISKVLGELLKHTVPGIYEILSGGRGQ